MDEETKFRMEHLHAQIIAAASAIIQLSAVVHWTADRTDPALVSELEDLNKRTQVLIDRLGEWEKYRG